MNVKLLTDHTSFHRLHELCAGRKRSVSIDCDTLERLLIDHSAMVALLGKAAVLPESTPRRERPSLTTG